MNSPKVSCVCPTFSRAYLLEEALESFLRQDYVGEKELIICNDFPKQEFIFDHPEVKVINLSERCPNLGNKRNTSYSYATGEYMLTWGDDDIHLPKRISRMMSAAIRMDSEFLLEGSHIILYAGKISYQSSLVAGPNIISRRIFDEVGGIPEKNSGEDQSFNSILRKHLNKPKPDVCDDPDAQFFYRFTSPRPHVSQFGFDKDGQLSGYEIMLIEANKYIESGKEPSGVYELRPHWKTDWVEDVRVAISLDK